MGVMALALACGVTAPASAATAPKPTRAELAKAMLTLPQLTRLGLAPLSGPGATVDGSFDPSLRFSRQGRQLHAFTFATATSPGETDQRDVMIDVGFGLPDDASVACRIDEGSPEIPSGADACVSVRRPGGGRAVGVSYGIRPSPGVNVTAYVSDDPVSRKPAWAYPSVKQLTAAAKALATAQVARLRAQGLLPAG